MKKKYHVKLDKNQRDYIQTIINSNSTSSTIRKLANILLLMDETVGKPQTQDEISKRCGVCDVTVYNTIRNYCENGIEHVLQFQTAKEPQNPRIITGEEEARLIALACSEPPKGFSKWTVRLLSKKMAELEIVDSVSPETVRKALKKRN